MFCAAINGLWLLPLILPAMVVFWLGIVALVSVAGGWRRLAREFPAFHRPEGLDLRGRSLHINPLTNYNGCMRVTLSSAGIYLEPVWLFRFCHPPVLIPWEKAAPMQSGRALWITRYFVPIEAAGKSMRLDLPKAAEEWVGRYVKDHP